jgi:hypothetical protein
MDSKRVNLTEALASFDDVYSPRIAAHLNDYDVKIAKAKGTTSKPYAGAASAAASLIMRDRTK